MTRREVLQREAERFMATGQWSLLQAVAARLDPALNPDGWEEFRRDLLAVLDKADREEGLLISVIRADPAAFVAAALHGLDGARLRKIKALAMRVAIELLPTQEEAAKFLGINPRTLRNNL